MKNRLLNHRFGTGLLLCLTAGLAGKIAAAPATLLFEDDFNYAFPGWTAVQPLGVYIDGPMRWTYDVVAGAWNEQSNIYTDNASASPSATAVMLINDAVTGDTFTISARCVHGDDDAFGLIFGYADDVNFYRVTFGRQADAARANGNFPGTGWKVDRKLDDVQQHLFGSGTPGGATWTNTANVPFDVTISVTGGTTFSLTVVDDPENAALTHNLVVNQTLPSSAAGRVGLMAWGMSGGAARGINFLNLNLSPGPLVNYPPAVLADWTHLITPDRNGSAALNNHLTGLWGLGLTASGPSGTLRENGDSFGGNDAAHTADFITSAMVAGDPGWDNYVYTARISSPDDDGVGMMFRYQDENNYYRIGFRRQNSTSGVTRGFSVMKAVAGQFEVIFSESANHYIYPANTPFDVAAAISGDQLRVLIVTDPNGSATARLYGPFDMAGTNGIGTLSQGKVGVFGWATAFVDYDFVRVQQVNGVPLLVSSPFGDPTPEVGLQDFVGGTMVEASVEAIVNDLPGTRRVNTGFTGFGSVPASGMGNSVSFTLDTFSLVNWTWRTEYQLMATAGAGGSVTGPTEEWQAAGTSVTLEAIADTGFLFAGWTGDSSSITPILSFAITGPFAVAARFEPDTDNDGLFDSFEQTYFSNLNMGAGDDPDMDGSTNLEEQQAGTDPTFAEVLVADDGLESPLENAQRDIALPGQFATTDFGMGYRGAWDVSNDFRAADDTTRIGATSFVANVSFDGPAMVIRNDVWDPSWSAAFTAQGIFTVGDNDGNCLYWRYQNHSNWYRVTVTGEENNASWRAPFGVSVQKRVGNAFVQLAADATIFTDPDDGTDPLNLAGWKRIRITVTASGADFTVTVEGYDAFVLQDWTFPVTLNFSDPDLAEGRVAIGDWGQGGDPAGPTAQIPVDDGVLIEDLRIEVGGTEVFHHDWSTAPLVDEFPAGWENPYAGVPGAEGDWRMSAHGTIFQMSNYSPPSSTVPGSPKGDAEGLVLLAPDPGVANYELQIGFHPFDDDGIGFVYDFQDTDNYARVLFMNGPTAATRPPEGLNVARKSNGVWSDIVLGDTSYLYTPGSPFAVRFANNNGEYRLTAWDIDNPSAKVSWGWQDQRAAENNRFGLACWGMQDAHFLHARAYSLPARAQLELRIDRITYAGGMVTLYVTNTTGAPYDVEVTTSLAPISWSTAASGQNGAEWTGAAPSGADLAVYRLVSSP